MAGVKISNLPAATSVVPADVVPVVDGGVTKKVSLALLARAGSPLALAYRSTAIATSLDPATDCTLECTGASSFSVTLPDATTCAKSVFNIQQSGTGIVSIATTGGQTVAGQASNALQLSQYDCATVQSNGTNWLLL